MSNKIPINSLIYLYLSSETLLHVNFCFYYVFYSRLPNAYIHLHTYIIYTYVLGQLTHIHIAHTKIYCKILRHKNHKSETKNQEIKSHT